MKTTDCFAVQFMGGKKLKQIAGSENGLEPGNSIYAFWTNLRVSNNVLQFCNPDTISCNSVIPTQFRAIL